MGHPRTLLAPITSASERNRARTQRGVQLWKWNGCGADGTGWTGWDAAAASGMGRDGTRSGVRGETVGSLPSPLIRSEPRLIAAPLWSTRQQSLSHIIHSSDSCICRSTALLFLLLDA